MSTLPERAPGAADFTNAIPARESTDRPPAMRRAMLGLGLGNTLEWYDWQIFGLLAVTIGPHFFRNESSVDATLSALSIFAVGFAMRPIGGIVLGGVADRIGRRRVMLLSVAMMALTTLVIGVIPDASTIGVAAPLILLVCRLLQGISTGVEAPLSTAYGAEVMPKGRSGTAAGIISFFVNFGILLASLINYVLGSVLGNSTMADWGWRIPFWVGAAMGLVVLWLRRSLPETLHNSDPDYVGSASKVWRSVFTRWRSLLAIIFVVGAAQAFNYGWNVGLPTLARAKFGEDPTTVFGITTVLALIMMGGSLIVGPLADRWKLSRVFLFGRFLMIPAVFLVLLYAHKSIATFTVVLLVGAPVLLVNMTLYVLVSTSLMPKGVRAAGCGLGYGVGVAAFGGTASYLVVWLSDNGLSDLFPVYMAVLAGLSIAFYQWAKKAEGVSLGA
ncbi:MFS transporter [Streptomyces chiangmaiensis]|uniref:MFS transporter n=2 Tax=Streptomyces chiangmaiensis TaxID=766497 RepID=A0ABU7FVL2_9ACTN|nr:MFS transporter [Streptomyces chiangmaiensis]MED7828150.1 MFS transporter [Streptomyces chiangmaiensis]